MMVLDIVHFLSSICAVYVQSYTGQVLDIYWRSTGEVLDIYMRYSLATPLLQG
jgi:hypothetical protein